MQITRKNMYAIRAVFELARHPGKGPLKTADIAAEQKIPVRFLEVILSHLKRCGVVTSKRGLSGGYTLRTPPDQITVGDILRIMNTGESAHCVSCVSKNDCELKGECAFMPMWDKAYGAMIRVLDRTTIQHLLEGKIPD